MEPSRCIKLLKCASAVAAQCKLTLMLAVKVPLKITIKTCALDSQYYFCPAGFFVDLKWNNLLCFLIW